MRVRITDIQESSSEYRRKDEIIGLVGKFEKDECEKSFSEVGFICGRFYPDGRNDYIYSHGFKYETVEEYLKPCWKCGKKAIRVGENGLVYDDNNKNQVTNFVSCVQSCMPSPEKYTVEEWQNHSRPWDAPEPSAMSELAGCAGLDVSTYEYDFSKIPKKKSIIQKIRDYDRLELALSEALHDRDLHATVADVWQERLICVQKDYIDATEMIGRRLKFSVGHNHIEIIVGNPVTLCSNYVNDSKYLDYTDNDISRCSEKDEYNWKTGAIQSLENLCEHSGYSKELHRDLRKALAKEYPGVFTK
jgi:hypothetical protein